VTLRDYSPDDLEALCAIDRACFDPAVAYTRKEMAALLGRPAAVAIVAEAAPGRLAGFVAARKHANRTAHIITLDVLPAWRGRGLGRRLMLCCEERLRAAGVRKVRLETAVGNRRAQALYRSLGYTRIRCLRRYYATGENAWVMEKTLAAEPAKEPSEERQLVRA